MMELDEFNYKAEQLTGEDAVNYAQMIKFLENDIAGYKTIIEDLRDGSKDFTGNLYDITSLPADLVGLYNDFYLPMLSEDDRSDEDAAMALKSQYAVDLAKVYLVKLGQLALSNEVALSLMSRNDAIVATIGQLVMQDPELLNVVTDENKTE
ncbi:hypothetical protein TALC_00776 [Thermoplasmatales archaeon BRNA1]|nr:hypothetical protein TALC_00776 [Thermoplasmatales archaeon BRNA1]